MKQILSSLVLSYPATSNGALYAKQAYPIFKIALRPIITETKEFNVPYFIQFIKKYMQEKKLNQAQFAKLIGRSESAVCNYLKGKRLPDHPDFKSMICLMFRSKRAREKALIECYFGAKEKR